METETPAPSLPRTALFTGDSITACGRGNDPDHLGYGWVRLVAEHLAAHEPGTRVLNHGHDGARAQDLAAHVDDDVLAAEPDLLTILIGVNDAIAAPTHDGENQEAHARAEAERAQEFERGLRFVLDQVSATRPSLPVILMSPAIAPVDPVAAHGLEHLAIIHDVMRDLAHEFRCAFVDLQEVWREGLAAGHEPGGLAEDGIHPTIAGHRLIADAWIIAAREVAPRED